MSNLGTTNPLNNPIWLTLKDTCQLLNLAEKTIKNKCRSGEFIYKVTQVKKKFYYYIKLRHYFTPCSLLTIHTCPMPTLPRFVFYITQSNRSTCRSYHLWGRNDENKADN